MTEKFGARLRVARELKNLGLRETARQVPMDPAYLSRIERGLQRPSVPILLALTRVLGLKEAHDAIARVWGDDG